MGYQLQKLSATKVSKLNKPGKYCDGGGLWLQVTPSLSKSWVFRFMLDGRSREMGLGSCSVFTLAEARLRALECRKLLAMGHDPIEHRNAARAARRLESAKALTFEQCANEFIETHKSAWRNPKHVDQWRNTLSTYVYPKFGSLSVAAIDITLVLKALHPIWEKKPETASRVRGRIEAILDSATARQLRKGDNPARWKGNLDAILPGRSKVAKVEHHAALPYRDLPTFMTTLRQVDGSAARALELTILTAARTGEIIAAKWAEFDLAASIWVVPAARMKAQREHRVPLSTEALKILLQMRDAKQSDYVFPGAREKRPLSNMAMLKVLERMNCQHLTTHGFRSTFRDWAAETTTHAHEVVEMALAHTIQSKVEAAYRRGDLFEKRRLLMHGWQEFCCGRQQQPENVVPLRPDAQRRDSIAQESESLSASDLLNSKEPSSILVR